MTTVHQWRTDLYRDCSDDFPGLRHSLTAALSGSGRLLVVPAGSSGSLTLTGRVSDVGGSTEAYRTHDLALDHATAIVTVEYALTDGNALAVAGGIITKAVPLAAATTTATIASATSASTRAVYAQLQREVAYEVARRVSFELEPMRVLEVSTRHVRVNYGAPLLDLGVTVLVIPTDSMAPIKCIVSSVSGTTAVLDVDGSGDLTHVAVGSLVAVINDDDPSEQVRRYERIDLP